MHSPTTAIALLFTLFLSVTAHGTGGAAVPHGLQRFARQAANDVAANINAAVNNVNGAVNNANVNNGRPVATGACCIEATSKKQDVCTKANGTPGVCAPSNAAGCGTRLTCV